MKSCPAYRRCKAWIMNLGFSNWHITNTQNSKILRKHLVVSVISEGIDRVLAFSQLIRMVCLAIFWHLLGHNFIHFLFSSIP